MNFIKEKLNLIINAYKKNMLSHAYLISGDLYGGQKLLADEIAKFLMCESENKTEEGICNTCKMCNLFNAQTHPDIHYVRPDDDKTVISIEKVRQIIESANKKPYYGKKSIYIIEEIAGMNVAGHNSMLKILEEPPEHVLFLLTTSKKHIILDTILSRVITVELSCYAEDPEAFFSENGDEIIEKQEFLRKTLYLPEIINYGLIAAQKDELKDFYVKKAESIEGTFNLYNLLNTKKMTREELIYIRTLFVTFYLDLIFSIDDITSKISAISDFEYVYNDLSVDKASRNEIFVFFLKYLRMMLRNKQHSNIIEKVFYIIEKILGYENYYSSINFFDIFKLTLCELED